MVKKMNNDRSFVLSASLCAIVMSMAVLGCMGEPTGMAPLSPSTSGTTGTTHTTTTTTTTLSCSQSSPGCTGSCAGQAGDCVATYDPGTMQQTGCACKVGCLSADPGQGCGNGYCGQWNSLNACRPNGAGGCGCYRYCGKGHGYDCDGYVCDGGQSCIVKPGTTNACSCGSTTTTTTTSTTTTTLEDYCTNYYPELGCDGPCDDGETCIDMGEYGIGDGCGCIPDGSTTTSIGGSTTTMHSTSTTAVA
jgi:hypothetical protein